MEEIGSWLEGRQMSRDEAARPGQGAGVLPLAWTGEAAPHLLHGRSQPQAGSSEHNVSYHLEFP